MADLPICRFASCEIGISISAFRERRKNIKWRLVIGHLKEPFSYLKCTFLDMISFSPHRTLRPENEPVFSIIEQEILWLFIPLIPDQWLKPLFSSVCKMLPVLLREIGPSATIFNPYCSQESYLALASSSLFSSSYSGLLLLCIEQHAM